MRRIWGWAAVACTGGVDDVVEDTQATDAAEESASPDTDMAPRPAWRFPADATDVDPDPGVVRVELTAAPAQVDVAGRTVEGYAYEGQVPGPTIRAKVGDVLEVVLSNRLSDPTTIHWHGAGAPFEMDGVPWMRAPTPPGGTFTYRFPLERAGTFWYHPHFDTAHQVDRGLYGMLVVEDPSEPAYDHDLVAVFDSWGEDDDDAHGHDPEGSHLVWTVNGEVDPVWEVSPGQSARLRVLNASNTGYLALSLDGARVLAHDQGVQGAPQDLDGLVLGPGDRAELDLVTGNIQDLTTAPWSLHGGEAWGDRTRLASVVAQGAAAGTAVVWTVEDEAPTPDPGTTDVVYTLQGDGGSDAWRINHEAFPDVTIAEVDLGDDVIVEVRNLSPTNHPFHGHGHAFEVLSIDGVVPPRRRVEDTLDIGVLGVARLRFTATRPGDWMQHCHILPHADGGMMTVLRVRDGE